MFNSPFDTFTVKEKVGIGTDNPSERLEVKGNIKLNSGVAVNEFSSNGTFGAANNQSVPTTQAVKTYVDTNLATKANLNGASTQDFQVKNLTAQGNLQATGTVTAAKFIGDGSGLTGLAGATQWVNGAAGSISYSGDVGIGKNLSFGTSTRQMIDLCNKDHGIGVQNSTTYFRSSGNFAWFAGGVHNDALNNPGGGTKLMSLNGSGDLAVTRNANINNTFLGDVGHGDTWAGFSHRSSVSTAGYALLQSNNGLYTVINKKSGGGYIGFQVDNVPKMTIDDAGQVSIVSNLSFGARTRQMIDLWNKEYGIGVQAGTTYFRSGGNFAWFAGGVHNDEYNNPGGGTKLMYLNGAGDLCLSARTNPSNNPNGSECRALVDWGNKLIINFNGDYSNGVDIFNGRFVSSREYKENIAELSTQEATIALKDLNPVKFSYKTDRSENLHVGFIAEDVPDLLAAPDKRSIGPLDVVAVLTKVVQEQQSTIASLIDRLNVLEAKQA